MHPIHALRDSRDLLITFLVNTSLNFLLSPLCNIYVSAFRYQHIDHDHYLKSKWVALSAWPVAKISFFMVSH